MSDTPNVTNAADLTLTLSVEEILEHWPTQGPLWIMDPNWFHNNDDAFCQAVERATSEHMVLLQDMIKIAVEDQDADLSYFITRNAYTPEPILAHFYHESQYGNMLPSMGASSSDLQDALCNNLSVDWLEDHVSRVLDAYSRFLQDTDLQASTTRETRELIDTHLKVLATHWYEPIVREIAQHPSTPAHILDFIAQQNDYTINQAILRNPNVSADTVLYTYKSGAANHTYDVLIAKHPHTPVSLLYDFAAHPDKEVAAAIVLHPHMPDDLREKLAQDDRRYARAAIAEDLRTPLHLLKRLIQDPEHFVRKHALGNPLAETIIPADLLQTLIVDNGGAVRRTSDGEYIDLDGTSSNDSTDTDFDEDADADDISQKTDEHADLLAVLTEVNPYWSELMVQANSLLTPVAQLQELAQHPDEWIRCCVAQNPHTPEDILHILSKDSNVYVRKSVERNLKILQARADVYHIQVMGYPPHAPEQTDPAVLAAILAQAAKHWHINVRKIVAENPHTSIETLRELDTDPNPDIQYYIAHHPHAPADLLEKYAASTDGNTRQQVATHPNTPVACLEVLLHDEADYTGGCVTANPSAPASLLAKAIEETQTQKSDTPTRNRITKNPNAPADLLRILVQDTYYFTRYYIAQHPNTPVDVQISLLDDERWRTLEAIADRPEIRAQSDRAKNPSVSLAELMDLSTHWHPHVRKAVAQHLHTPPALLEILGQDQHILVRCAVAMHPHTPITTLENLAQDSDRNMQYFIKHRAFLLETLLV